MGSRNAADHVDLAFLDLKLYCQQDQTEKLTENLTTLQYEFKELGIRYYGIHTHVRETISHDPQFSYCTSQFTVERHSQLPDILRSIVDLRQVKEDLRAALHVAANANTATNNGRLKMRDAIRRWEDTYGTADEDIADLAENLTALELRVMGVEKMENVMDERNELPNDPETFVSEAFKGFIFALPEAQKLRELTGCSDQEVFDTMTSRNEDRLILGNESSVPEGDAGNQINNGHSPAAENGNSGNSQSPLDVLAQAAMLEFGDIPIANDVNGQARGR
ncbi:hypothetical protein KC318_g396 [Hortaea werneckii]|nr:hypothetical protein KC334_g278 [Hortaea werneckii]KAI7025788.1 hypothetical protein KC355_g896 [Hortaea werneckii]KAI7204378.1 hypothetical protein KC324_g796 [Hortaea werneckii]KAI7595143.1 hypothetical protein KC316_g714 [Hortaea werneckii]KAI7676235.1 hypothetical protein KC318_g396 [Hortaea werneckii]